MDIKAILLENGKRVTNERILLFCFIKKTHIFTARSLQNCFPNIGRASIFRTLRLFNDIWIIRKIGKESYEINDGENHHEHMKCEKCNTLFSFDSHSICSQIFRQAERLGFRIKSHNVWVTGVCKNCLSS